MSGDDADQAAGIRAPGDDADQAVGIRTPGEWSSGRGI